MSNTILIVGVWITSQITANEFYIVQALVDVPSIIIFPDNEFLFLKPYEGKLSKSSTILVPETWLARF